MVGLLVDLSVVGRLDLVQVGQALVDIDLPLLSQVSWDVAWVFVVQSRVVFAFGASSFLRSAVH